MKRKTIILTVSVMALLFPLISFSQSPIKGNWKHIEYHFESPDTSFTWTNMQPSLYMFDDKYYSMMYVGGEKPRPLVSVPIRDFNLEQFRAMILPFLANSGTYEITDNTFIINPIVAMYPNFMENGSWTFSFEMRDGYLWLTRNFSDQAKGVYKLEKLP